MNNIIKEEQKKTAGNNATNNSEETLSRVKRAFPLHDYWLLLFFVNGEVGLYDCAWILQHSSMEKLHKTGFFKKVLVSRGGVKWNKRIAIGSEELYRNSFPLTDDSGNLLKLL